MRNRTTIKPPIPTTSGFHNFAFYTLHFDFSSLAPLYLSRILYKSTPFYAKQTQFQGYPNESKYLFTKGLRKFYPAGGAKNKPNSNPIKANFQKDKMNVNSLTTKDYRKKDDFSVRINKPNPPGLRCLLTSCRTDQTQFKCLETYTRSTTTFISLKTRTQLFSSVKPHALAVAAFIAVPSAEPASDLSLRPFKNPANRKSPQPTVDNTLPRPIHLPRQTSSFVPYSFCHQNIVYVLIINISEPEYIIMPGDAQNKILKSNGQGS